MESQSEIKKKQKKAEIKADLKTKTDIGGTARIRTAVQESQTLEDRPGYPTVPRGSSPYWFILLKSFLVITHMEKSRASAAFHLGI